jgi:NAD(P)-dependent dehydrogenase (short-subunit alcohol dehydrogenase family)
VRELDLADLASIHRFAAGWEEPLDVLVNNAGVANTPLMRTVDGFELQMGTNHLGHFALTALLLDRIADRIVAVSSNAHKNAVIDVDDLNWERRTYRASAAYAQSKLANLLFVLELQRRLSAAGSPVRAIAAHPGIAATNLNRHLGPALAAVSATVGRLISQSDAEGARSIVHAATAGLPGGSYVGPGGRGGFRGAPALVGRSRRAQDADLAVRLWAASERLTASVLPRPLAAP